ncbi:MAG: NADH-quinone oxidoreductase subunit C, partial [Dermatophilaceae bacterium]|nr:NADH-quinone oxidoreductase subunit C [Dermatophilaceae bacterium]
MSDGDKKDAVPAVNADTTKDQTSGITPGEVELAQPGSGSEPKVVGMRRGMFGATRGADTTGYSGLLRPILIAGAAERPYGGYFDEIADNLERGLVGGTASYAEAVASVVIDRGEMTMHVRREHLVAVARVLRDDPSLRFEICTGVSGVHYPDRVGEELHAVYHFLSITNGGRRVRVEVSCPDDDRHIPSIVSVYPANDWHERETWDMFGIEFDGHPALTRI